MAYDVTLTERRERDQVEQLAQLAELHRQGVLTDGDMHRALVRMGIRRSSLEKAAIVGVVGIGLIALLSAMSGSNKA